MWWREKCCSSLPLWQVSMISQHVYFHWKMFSRYKRKAFFMIESVHFLISTYRYTGNQLTVHIFRYHNYGLHRCVNIYLIVLHVVICCRFEKRNCFRSLPTSISQHVYLHRKMFSRYRRKSIFIIRICPPLPDLMYLATYIGNQLTAYLNLSMNNSLWSSLG